MAKQELMKHHFRETLMRMCETRRLDEITATDLINEAGVSRQSFYNYFSDIDDAICYTASAPLLTGNAPLFSPQNTRIAWQYATEHRGFFGQLHRHKGIHAYFDTLTNWLVERGSEVFLTPDLSEEERHYRWVQLVSHAAGCVNAYRVWAANGMQVHVDVATEALHSKAPDFIRDSWGQTQVDFPEYPR